MRRLIPVVAAALCVLLVVVAVRAGTITAPDARPGECSNNVQYTQRFQFLPTAFDTHEFLQFISDYHGCDVHISDGFEEGTQRDGFYIWYRLPPISEK